MIELTIEGITTMSVTSEPIITGSSAPTVHIILSDEWEDLTKIAVFTNGTTVNTVIPTDADDGVTCTIPYSLLTSGATISVGLQGTDPDTEAVIRTTYTNIGFVTDGVVPNDDPGTSRSPELYEQACTVASQAKTIATSVQTDLASNYYTDTETDTLLAAKQDTISDLATIRNNAATGAGLASAVEANTAARHSHENKSVIDGITSALISAWNAAVTWVTTNGAGVLTHIADTVKHITASERTAWTAKYDKPSTGIPKTDLAETVQTSLGKADTALQEHQSLSAYRTSAAQDVIDAAQNTTIATKSVVSVSASGTATDEVQYITINGTEKKLAGGDAAVWGSITGDLDDQTDLKEVLDGKQQTIINDSESYSDPFGDYSSGYDVSIHYVT